MPADTGPGPERRSELRTRIASALVLVPIAIAALVLGGVVFALVVGLVAVIALWEWIGITAPTEQGAFRLSALAVMGVALGALAFVAPAWPIGLLAALTGASLLIGAARASATWIGLGILYVGVPSIGIIVLRQAEPAGWAAVLFILVVVWASDIAAFFAGRAFGGPRLWPRVSPKKTWSGAIGGIAAAIVLGGVTVWLTGADTVLAGLALAVPLSLASQAGDLLESAVKRRFGVKDSGTIIPGHGGVLDRVDGLFGAAALAWLIAGLGLGGDILMLPDEFASLSGIS